MDESIERFIAWERDDRLRSPHTIARYRAVLGQLAAYADPIAATPADVEAWWNTRLDKAPATRANELNCLRAYYKWATRFGHRTDDPTRLRDAPPVDNKMLRGIGESDLKRLFAATEDIPDLRRAISLGAYGGLRVSEAAGLDWSHVDLERRRLYVRGKGRKERAIGLGAVLLDKLLPDTGGNVVTAGGRPYAGPTLQRKVNRLMQRHGIEHTFHDLRKRGASLAIARTHDIYAVSKAFGWSSIETASSYAAVSDDTLDAIAEAMS